MTSSAQPIDIDSYWEYDDPAASEQRFQAALEHAEGDGQLELLTQIARTHGLRGNFEHAHQILDQVEPQLADAGPRPAVRYQLERGRTFNSSGETEQARALFEQAWELAGKEQLEGLAVDAAHMLAITYGGTEQAIEWNRKGLEIARSSQAPKAISLVPAMLNNGAWDLHEMGRYQEALELFEEAEQAWTARGKDRQIQIARWSVARCLRSLERFEQALEIQRQLEAEHQAAGTSGGYVFEELAELLAALPRADEARGYFKKAYDELSKDDWFTENEAERLASLKARAQSSWSPSK